MADEQEPDIRFSLANERTLLAYQRTAIGLIAAAVAVVHFLDNKAISVLLAATLLASGGVAAVGGYERYRAADRAIREGSALPGGHAPIAITFGLTLCLVVAAAYVVIHVA